MVVDASADVDADVVAADAVSVGKFTAKNRVDIGVLLTRQNVHGPARRK